MFVNVLLDDVQKILHGIYMAYIIFFCVCLRLKNNEKHQIVNLTVTMIKVTVET